MSCYIVFHHGEDRASCSIARSKKEVFASIEEYRTEWEISIIEEARWTENLYLNGDDKLLPLPDCGQRASSTSSLQMY